MSGVAYYDLGWGGSEGRGRAVGSEGGDDTLLVARMATAPGDCGAGLKRRSASPGASPPVASPNGLLLTRTVCSG